MIEDDRPHVNVIEDDRPHVNVRGYAVETMLDSKNGRADMSDVEEIEDGISVDIS